MHAKCIIKKEKIKKCLGRGTALPLESGYPSQNPIGAYGASILAPSALRCYDVRLSHLNKDYLLTYIRLLDDLVAQRKQHCVVCAASQLRLFTCVRKISLTRNFL